MSEPTGTRTIVFQVDRQFILFIAKAALFLLALLLVLWILPHSQMVVTPLIIAMLLAFVLNPVVLFLEQRGWRRSLAASAIMLGLTLIFILLAVWVFPLISREVQVIIRFINNETPSTMVAKLKVVLAKYVPMLKDPAIIDKVLGKLEGMWYSFLSKSLSMIPGIFSTVVMIILIPFMTFFLLKDGRRIKRAVIEAVPNRYFEMSINLLHKVDNQLGSYLRSQLLVSIIIGILSITALAILRVPYFLLIGMAAGLANMIPYFGPIVGAVPALILNVIDKGNIAAALKVIIAFLLIRLIDDTLVSPNIIGRGMKIHPLLVIIVIFIGGEMFGLMGLLLCIPVTGIVLMIIKQLVWNFSHYRCFQR